MLVTADYIKDNGIKRREKEMELESSSGLMVLNTKVCGLKIRLTVREG